MDDLQPGQRPRFMQSSGAVADEGYPGLIEDPKFDEELAAQNDPSVEPVAGAAPSLGIQERWRAIARLHARGQNSQRIAKKLNYSPPAVARVLTHQWVRDEVARFRAAYDSDPNSKIKDAALDSIDALQELILDERTKPNIVADISKFILEKATGKAKQEISVESGSLMQYMDMLKGMQIRGEAIDVTPPPQSPGHGTPQIEAGPAGSAAAQSDPWNTWLDNNS